jgi:hypothetical protein
MRLSLLASGNLDLLGPLAGSPPAGKRACWRACTLAGSGGYGQHGAELPGRGNTGMKENGINLAMSGQ